MYAGGQWLYLIVYVNQVRWVKLMTVSIGARRAISQWVCQGFSPQVSWLYCIDSEKCQSLFFFYVKLPSIYSRGAANASWLLWRAAAGLSFLRLSVLFPQWFLIAAFGKCFLVSPQISNGCWLSGKHYCWMDFLEDEWLAGLKPQQSNERACLIFYPFQWNGRKEMISLCPLNF